ncbi:Hpt domain-containing protein [Marinobacter sp.]|uniref:Hpt domain-containing protein n=1 Tax=Marinobacter sp. TaxID=50741 RepID=UPI0019FBD8DE|nr:Hpt domain-containing protein [Marinobacter sp.]MBE0485311.1 Hpt domain-containing protein [Marinobacter sp.]
MTDKPHLDEEALAELQDVMDDEFDVLIQTYLADSRTRLDSLWQTLNAGDADGFAKSAHSFKGSCVNIGAPCLGALCMEAEQLGKAGKLEAAPAVVKAIEAEFSEVSARLTTFGDVS